MTDTSHAEHEQERAPETPDVIIITGMSGAGRTEAMHTFEDLGYYVIDNLPPSLILDVARMSGLRDGIGRHLAVVCDLRTQGDRFGDLNDALAELDAHAYTYGVIYLEASDETLRRRYALARRPHPLAGEGETTLETVRRERELLHDIRQRASFVIDTSDLTAKELRSKLRGAFTELSDQQLMEVNVFSFGFKYGMPEEADLIIDVRFLPNPYWDPEMRQLTGRDALVRDFVLNHPQTQAFLEVWHRLLDTVMPGYVSEGKSRLSIGVGCSGGQHRSVALANETAAYLMREGYHVIATHRDLYRAEAHRQ
ncbi:MAG: RNase adapter RapZ [Atopobiaceae bacterium]|nr:RNase adapter RapZ [Atopobiaceae bacterium]